MTARRIAVFLPVMVFAVLVAFLAWRLELIGQGNLPDSIPSVMINRPAPVFSLPALTEGKPHLTSEMFKGKIILIDMFASWCAQCRIEHPLLDDIKKAGIVLVGIDYKDKATDADMWLEKFGNPYEAIGADADGRVAIDFGLYGVPESYLIDKKGFIRFKQTGPLTPEVIQTTLLPLAKELSK